MKREAGERTKKGNRIELAITTQISTENVLLENKVYIIFFCFSSVGKNAKMKYKSFFEMKTPSINLKRKEFEMAKEKNGTKGL
jgi:hypothetical protein